MGYACAGVLMGHERTVRTSGPREDRRFLFRFRDRRTPVCLCLPSFVADMSARSAIADPTKTGRCSRAGLFARRSFLAAERVALNLIRNN